MGGINVDPILTLADGSQLLVSTQYSGDEAFACELYLATRQTHRALELTLVSEHIEAATCREAQTAAYQCAQRLYPHTRHTIKRPPYLIWGGPQPSSAHEHRGYRHWRQRR
ncbi:hypothetical protein [Candidatus Nitrospira bockiana]